MRGHAHARQEKKEAVKPGGQAAVVAKPKEIVRARAIRVGFMGKGSGLHRVRPDKVINVTAEFFEENKHWLVKESKNVVADNEKSELRPSMDVI